jgi:hypothetical protein
MFKQQMSVKTGLVEGAAGPHPIDKEGFERGPAALVDF